MERKYAAFISYRHAELDSAVAKSLHTLIEQYRIPKTLQTNGKKKLGIVFRDEEELSATNDLTDKIYTALDNSEHLVVICTKSTLQSPWVTKEVEHFLKNHDRNKAHIILADGEPMEVFPRPLTHTEHENGIVEVTEPMAVDIRAESIPAVKKKLKAQILRLVAAMLDCPYDALAMREQRRKRHRFAAVMSVILAVAIGFSTVLLIKNRQIDQKNAELDSANTALESKNEELDKKNEQLEDKNSEVLLRESELLASNSKEAFNEGDNYTAIANAAMALPTEDDPRPYYAPAEAALLTALSPFDDEDNYIMRDTVLEQSTPVNNFRISADGSKLATMDIYSVINIFDTVTGEILNTIQLNTNTAYLSFTNVHLLYCPETDYVIAFDGFTVAAISFETCDIAWTHTANFAQTDFICPSSDGSIFAYVRSAYDETDNCTDTELVFLSGKTGEIVSTSKLIDASLYSKDNHKATYFVGFAAQGMYNGRFSSDNKRFATTFFTKDDNDVYTINYSITDISTGTSEIFCSFEIDGYYISNSTYFLFFDTEDTVVSVRQNTASGYIMLAERINIKNGSILWQTPLPKASLSVSTSEDDSIFCFTTGVSGTTAYTILGDTMHIFDTQTGELISTLKLTGKIMDAEVVSGSFVYVLDDGHYSTGILSTYGISDTGDSIDLGDTLRMRVWNGGPTVLSGSDISETGYLATIPTDNPRSVVIKRVSLIEQLFPCEESAAFTDEYLSTNSPRELKDGSVAFGAFFSDGKYYFKIINPKTGELIKDFPVQTTSNAEDIHFLPDASSALTQDGFGNITLYKEDGSTEVLNSADYTLISYSNQLICNISTLSAACILSESGDVLSAACTADSLMLWTNGENKREVPLPEDLKWLYFDSSSATFLMEVSPDGNVIISGFTNDDIYIDRLAVYNTVNNSWNYIDLGDIPLSIGFISFSEDSSKFALLDDNGDVRLMDSSGKIYSQFSLLLPANSVTQMDLILDDAYVLLKTSDLQVLIYDTATGEIVYRETVNTISTSLLHIYHDSVNNRLYLAPNTSTVFYAGLCIDIGSWTTLTHINGFIYFNENTLEIYRIATLEGSYNTGIVVQILPPAEKLSKLARDFLGI